MPVVKEPQGVQELMTQTEAEWQRQIDACDDATGPDRAELRDALAALRAEYTDADYPRREVIGRELRELIRRYDALASPQAAPPPRPDAGETAVEPLPDEAPATAVAEMPAETPPEPGTIVEAPPHGPVPLGVEAAPVGERGAPREPDEPSPAPEPVAPEPSGPVPHGSPGLSRDVVREAEVERAPGPGDGDGADGKWDSLWGRVRGTATRWVRTARLTVAYEVLLRKRAARQMELGIRVWQLSRRDALGDAETDAGVAERLRQIERVEAAIRENRDRYRAVPGSGTGGD